MTNLLPCDITRDGSVDERRLSDVLTGLLYEVDPDADPARRAYEPADATNEGGAA